MARLVRRFASAIGVRRGEGAPVAWLIVHSLFNGVFAAFFLTAANALFLARFEISFLPLAYIAAAVVGYVAVMLFSRLEKRLSVGTLMAANLAAMLMAATAFWLLKRSTDNPWVVFFMFVAVGPMFSLLALGYWGLAGRLFDLRQGKRLFGLVGAGEEVSTIIGLFSTPVLLRLLGGPDHLLLLAAAGLAGSLIVVMVISGRFRDSLSLEREARKGEATEEVGLSSLLRVRYFLLMAAAIILLNFALYIVDFGFLAQIRVKFQGPGQIARFIGLFYGATKVVELLMKVAVTGRLLSQFGLGVGLLVLPALLAVSSGFAILIGTFGLGAANFFVLVALSKLVAIVAKSSAFEPSFRVLYQPIRGSDRLVYQSHVEGTARQIAIGVIGLALMMFSRGQASNALALFYVLVPILAALAVAAILAHREYRARLFASLREATARPVSVGPLDQLMPAITGPVAAEQQVALHLLERIEPGAIPAALIAMLEHEDPSVRCSALEFVGLRRRMGSRRQVAELRKDPDPAVRLAAARSAELLADFEALLKDRARLDELARSPEAEDRLLAAIALGYGSSADADRISVLLWDRETEVREAALGAAGRLGNPEFRPMLIRHLGIPAFSQAAESALVDIGRPALADLEKAFGQPEQTPAVRRQILDIFRGIGDAEALALLFQKLETSDRNLRRRALELLVEAGYRATPEQAPAVDRAVESLVREMAWDMGAFLALEEDAASADVRKALEAELSDARAWLFDLLSLVYDPGAIAVVKESLAGGSPQAIVHALEILDLLLSPALKPLVFPVLEDQSYHQVLRKLDAYSPARRRETPVESLVAMPNREYGKLGLWIRALALDTLGRLPQDVRFQLVAFLFHPGAMLREIAALRLAARDRPEWEAARRRLPFDVREELDAVVTAEKDGDAETRSIFGRARFFRTVPDLVSLSSEDVLALAKSSEERRLAEGQALPNPRDPKDSFFVLVDGELVIGDESGPAGRIHPGRLIAFSSGARSVTSVGESRLIRVEPSALFGLAQEDPRLVPVCLGAVRVLLAWGSAR